MENGHHLLAAQQALAVLVQAWGATRQAFGVCAVGKGLQEVLCGREVQ